MTLTETLSLIVGLGNPGSGYEQTRHNAGFWFVDALAQRYAVQFRDEKRFHGAVATLELNGSRVYLLKPYTYMNRSGQSVAALCRFYRIPVSGVLVAHDELDINVGAVRLKCGGGHGGHNGLRDIVSANSNDADFLRLRIGIGHPGDSSKVVGYVLHKPSIDERVEIDAAIEDAVAVVPLLQGGDLQQAQQQLHSR
jgi:PTH1 family peptidyl-tRNA hydrolase